VGKPRTIKSRTGTRPVWHVPKGRMKDPNLREKAKEGGCYVGKVGGKGKGERPVKRRVMRCIYTRRLIINELVGET